MSNLISSDAVAWWGAISGTAVLIWDVIKQLRNGAKLRITSRPDTYYPDSEVLKEERLPNGHVSNVLRPSIHVEVVNYGNLPTTLIKTDASRSLYGGWLGSTNCKSLNGKSLPVLLGPGEVWSGRFDQLGFEQEKCTGPVILSLVVSHKKKPLLKKVKLLGSKDSD